MFKIFETPYAYTPRTISQFDGYIAKVGRKIVGFILYKIAYFDILEREALTIYSLGVDSEYQGCKIGQMLLEISISYANNIGHNLHLMVRVSNEKAINLYLKYFNIIARVKDYYVNPLEDGLLLRCRVRS